MIHKLLLSSSLITTAKATAQMYIAALTSTFNKTLAVCSNMGYVKNHTHTDCTKKEKKNWDSNWSGAPSWVNSPQGTMSFQPMPTLLGFLSPVLFLPTAKHYRWQGNFVTTVEQYLLFSRVFKSSQATHAGSYRLTSADEVVLYNNSRNFSDSGSNFSGSTHSSVTHLKAPQRQNAWRN